MSSQNDENDNRGEYDVRSDTDNGQPENAQPENGQPETNTSSVKANALALRASTSLAQLSKALNSVHAFVRGRTKKPILLFRSRKSDGTWEYGRTRIRVEEGSRWAIDPRTFEHGWAAFNKETLLGEKLVPIDQAMPDPQTLPNVGVPWQKQIAFDLRCISGTDAGAEVTFKSTSVGGHQAFEDLVNAVRDRLDSGQHDDKLCPVTVLEKTFYRHPEYGPTWNPAPTIVDWMGFDGPASAPTPAPQPTSPSGSSSPSSSSAANEQPRRRRVA
jgi:hypothetical protein